MKTECQKVEVAISSSGARDLARCNALGTISEGKHIFRGTLNISTTLYRRDLPAVSQFSNRALETNVNLKCQILMA